MPAEKAPAYSWYPKDYDTDEAVKLMSYEQEGIYRRLLDHQALHGSIPLDPTSIAKLVPKVTQRRFLALWPALSVKFQARDGRLFNEKFERVKAYTNKRAATAAANGAKGAANRWRHDSG